MLRFVLYLLRNVMDKRYIEKEIKRILWTQRLLMDDSYTEKQLVKDIGTTRTELRRVLNDCFGTTYACLRNKMKVKEAKRIMAKRSKKINIEDVALIAGFNNRQTFTNQFEIEEGISPGLYYRRKRK